MSKSKKVAPRNTEAYIMILSGKGKAQVFGDRRNKRAKDHKNCWRADIEKNG